MQQWPKFRTEAPHGVVVAFDDGDSQSVGNSVSGMCQADDAGADDDDVDGLAGAVAGG